MPGSEVHFEMEPEMRRVMRLKGAQHLKGAKPAAVLALLFPDQNHNLSLVLMLRKSYPGVHSNQIGFPGGKVEQGDISLMATALRETHEEVGVPSHTIEVVRELTEVFIPPSNFLVTPFLGFCENQPVFIKEDKEVEKIILISVADLLNNENQQFSVVNASYAHGIRVPAFNLSGYHVWGATAMMLNEIKTILKEVIE